MDEKKWLKITIRCEPQMVDPISDFLIGVIEAGIETGAADEPHYGIIQAYVTTLNPSSEEVDEIVRKISSYLENLAEIFKLPVPELSSDIIVEQDWGKSWKEYFRPLKIVPGLVISPSWEEYVGLPEETVIVMDPGMAFGTGHHATTALCLELLQKISQQAPLGNVLDVGTGTGILAMASAHFGAAQVLGIDNDQDAVEAAKGNVRNNQLEQKVSISNAPLAAVPDLFDTIVANIISSVLLDMAENLVKLMAPGGSLVLSGILAGEQADDIIAAFRACGMSLREKRQQKEWVALLFEK